VAACRLANANLPVEMSSKSHPTRFFLLIFVVLGAGGALALHYLAGWPLLWSALLAINLAAYVLWAWDKRQAIRGGWRVPEAGLHVMAALGATPASFAAMLTLRHKIRKPLFWGLYVAFTLVQVAAIFYLTGRLDAA
jgi:uncharacterized membrane protein YsdA (DUF1294 family)